MKRTPLLHADLSGLIASMGHGDLLVVGDAGLPVPRGVRVIDLAVTAWVPGIFPVLDAILSEMVVERSIMAHEADPTLIAAFAERPVGAMNMLSHQQLKAAMTEARAVVRTGEFTPYANICLYAGVAF